MPNMTTATNRRKNVEELGLGKGWLILLYVALKPLYLRSSGSMQIADIYLIIISFYLFASRKRSEIWNDIYITDTIQCLALVCAFQAIVNLCWSIELRQNLMKSSLYYIFNLIAFVDCLVIGREVGIRRLKKSLVIGCCISMTIVIIGLILRFGGERGKGLFNNPNQLGFYCLIMLTILQYCKSDLNKFVWWFAIAASIWGIIASSSKAAFISGFVFIALSLIILDHSVSTIDLLKKTVIIILIAVMLYMLFYSDNPMFAQNSTLSSMRSRIMRMKSENDTSLGVGRGYNRITELGLHFFWGMGEGAYGRFKTLTGYEVHSTYASLIVSYGLIGFIGYLTVFLKSISLRKSGFAYVLMLSGILLYQISHNGIRNTLVWILLASILIESGLESNSKRNNNAID